MSMGTTSNTAKAPSSGRHTFQMPEMQSCIAACLECSKECEYCGEQCIGMPQMSECVRTCFDCATTCQTCVILMSRESPLHQKMCDLCADACARCAAECEKYDADYCKRCAAACRRCEQECRRMAQMGAMTA